MNIPVTTELIKIFSHDFLNYLLPIYAANLILGISSLPLTAHLFRERQSKGIALAPILGLLGAGYINFLLTTLFPLTFPLGKTTAIISLLMWASLNYIPTLLNKENTGKEPGLSLDKSAIKRYLFSFLLISILLYFLKAFSPEIYQIERTMSIGLLNVLENSSTLPPHDFWMAGKTVNYYYFGHFLAFYILKITGIPNLPGFYAVPIWMFTTLAFVIFEFGSNLLDRKKYSSTERKIAGSLSTYLVTFGGTFYALKWLIHGMLDILTRGEPRYYWYAEAIRPNDHTFLDIPLYSFLVHELHAHTWGFLFGGLVLNLLLSYWRELEKAHRRILITITFILGMAYMTNTWDTLSLGSLVTVTVLIRNSETWRAKRNNKGPLRKFLTILAIIGGTYIVALPWSISFQSPVTAITTVVQGTPLLIWLSYWGFPLLIAIWALLRHVRIIRGGIILDTGSINKFLWPLLILILGIILGVELLAFRDVLINLGGNNRFNTFWKFSVQAWVWATALTGPGILYLQKTDMSKRTRTALHISLGVSFLIISTFTTKAITQEVFRPHHPYTGIEYGDKFWRNIAPEEYKVYRYLQQTTTDIPQKTTPKVIAEASGISYTNSNFLAPFLGWQNILAWDNHQNTWRSDGEELVRRLTDIWELYTGEQLETSKEIMEKYQIDYIVISEKEWARFERPVRQEKLLEIAEPIYLLDNLWLLKTK